MIGGLHFSDRLEVRRGMVYRYVRASWKKTKDHAAGSVDVYRIDDRGVAEVRYLVRNIYGCYFIDASELRHPEWLEPIGDLATFKNDHSGHMTDEDRELVCTCYPKFSYTLKKAGEITRADCLNYLKAWKEDDRVELLIGAKLDHLATNKTFLRLNQERQRAILNFIRSTPGTETWNYNKLRFVMGGKGTPQDFDDWQDFRDYSGHVVPFGWWKKYGPDPDLYSVYLDYLRMAVTCSHDMRDPYWKYPKDIKKAHDKVMREYKRVQEALKIAKAKELERREKERRTAFGLLSEKYAGCTMEHSGLVVSVPDSIDSIRKQAEKLHQCLVTAGYIDRMLEGKCCLVFITDRKGKPIATAEILANGKTGQFYGDERGRVREKMTPNSTCQLCLEAYRTKFLRRLKKVMKEVA